MARQPATHVDDPRKVAVRLRGARENAGLSQRQLSFPGCTPAYISRIEAGTRVPSLQMINELATRLGVSAQWLATGVEPFGTGDSEILDAEVAARLGDVDDARRLYKARLRTGDPAYPAALAGLGQLAFREENVEQAIDYLEQALAARKGKALADPSAVETLGRAYAAVGELDRSAALFASALDEARKAEAAIEELRFAVLLANAQIDRGLFAEAEESLERVSRLADELGDPMAEARLYWSQSRLHVLRGDTQLAARYARRALDILERGENAAYVAMACHLLAYAEIDSGNGERALELLERGRTLFGGEMGKGDEAKFSLEEARAHLLLGDREAAAAAANETLSRVEFVDQQDRGRAYVALADVLVAVGDTKSARRLYEEAVSILAEQGKPYLLTAAGKLADLLEEAGKTKEALAVLRNAAAAHNRALARM